MSWKSVRCIRSNEEACVAFSSDGTLKTMAWTTVSPLFELRPNYIDTLEVLTV